MSVLPHKGEVNQLRSEVHILVTIQPHLSAYEIGVPPARPLIDDARGAQSLGDITLYHVNDHVSRIVERNRMADLMRRCMAFVQ